MGQVTTDPNDPNWGLPVTGGDPTDPTWGQSSTASTDAKMSAMPSKSTNTALSAAIVSHLGPYLEKGLMELATNPSVPKTSASIGRAIGGIAPIVGGAAEAGPIGALAGVGVAAKGAWAGGKTGWFTGKLAQNVAGHLAKIAEEVAPYMQHLQPAVGAQGVNDLAQMAEPNRTDIGVLGVGKSPDAIDQAVMQMIEKIQQGMKPIDAARAVTTQNPSLYPRVIDRWARLPR